VLHKVGGFEIGGIAGTILAAAYHKLPVVLDGIITTAGALLAYLLNPHIREFLFAGHKSVEQGHLIALKFMGLSPLLDLDMRLGEGSGTALAIDIIDVSCKIMCEMATFEEAHVDTAL
jgi:nicotinate-nucleotide--dimethylbenzimidazole phosphoribosyltransferase